MQPLFAPVVSGCQSERNEEKEIQFKLAIFRGNRGEQGLHIDLSNRFKFKSIQIFRLKLTIILFPFEKRNIQLIFYHKMKSIILEFPSLEIHLHATAL